MECKTASYVQISYGGHDQGQPDARLGSFLQLAAMNEFANIYGQVEWREGRPWKQVAGWRSKYWSGASGNQPRDYELPARAPRGRIDHSLGVVLAQW